jgi:hypothetical protein
MFSLGLKCAEYSIGEGLVDGAKDFDLDIGDLQQLCECRESVGERVPRSLSDQSFQLAQPIKFNEFTRKRRVLSHTRKLVAVKKGR